jgi:hypothetical protein
VPLNYCITSPVTKENMVQSAFAVLRLIVSTYMVGGCTGKSPGYYAQVASRVFCILAGQRNQLNL